MVWSPPSVERRTECGGHEGNLFQFVAAIMNCVGFLTKQTLSLMWYSIDIDRGL